MYLSNAELLSQVSNGRLTVSESADLLRISRKFSYYRNVGDMIKKIRKRKKNKVLDSDDISLEIAQTLSDSILRIGRAITNEKQEQELYTMIGYLRKLDGSEL